MDAVSQLIADIRPVLVRGSVIIFVCAVLVMAAAFIDMWTGIEAARANKERISSRGLRKTVAKVVDYLRVVMFAVLIDVLGLFFPWYELPYFAVASTLGILLIEGRSVLENFRRKRSHAASVVEVIGRIIEATSADEAEAIIRLLREEGKVRGAKGETTDREQKQ